LELLGLELNCFRRFEKASIDLLGQPIAIVGPNEAGKSSLLEALVHLNDQERIVDSDITRQTSPPDSAEIIKAWFSLDAGDRAAIAHIPEASAVSRFNVAKQRQGTLVGQPEPPLRRDRAPRKEALALLQRVMASRWADDNSDVVEEFFPPAETVLESDEANITAEDRAKLSALAGELEAEPPSTNPGKLASALKKAVDHESKPHPHSLVVAALLARRPEFLLFEEEDRELEGVYDLASAASDPPIALTNFAQLAKLPLVEVAAAAGRADFGALEGYQRAANASLGSAFSSAWQQSVMSVQVRLDHSELRAIVQNRSGNFTELGERSQGLRIFVALIGYLGPTQRKIAPVLLIDEAETHLHYDAQADLVRVLTYQDAAAKVIYTTHSAGCLPLDLGTGIRAVVMEDGDRSSIENSFWLLGAGYTQLIMAMGATALAFTPTRRAAIGEGACEAILLPTLLREAVDPTEVDYQIAPGLSNASQEAIAHFDLEAARVAYIVDGDTAGARIAKRLTDAGIRADRIVALGGAASGSTLEDLLDKAVYRDAVNAELRTWHQGLEITTAALKTTPVSRALRAWCRAKGVDEPDKVRVAAQVLKLARTQRVTTRAGRETLARLHRNLLAVLGKATHIDTPAAAP
jgi:predicted ATP-dependent endonuclease of OLD family